MTLILEVLGFSCLALGGAGCIYFFLLGLVPRRGQSAQVESTGSRIAVLVPAHNEEEVLEPLLGDLKAQVASPVRVLVVAHRCQDATEHIARAAGADVLVLSDGEGKSAALQAGFRELSALDWDAVLVIDADCRIDPHFLARARIRTSEVVQTRVHLCASQDGRGLFYELLYHLDDRLFHAGRERLGLPAFVRGTGMLLGRQALERCPWHGQGLTEDREQGLLFLRAGVPVRHAPELAVTTPPPVRFRESWGQRRRWTSAGLLPQLLGSLETARDASRYFGARSWELPLAVLADAKTQWVFLLAAGTVCLWLAGGPYVAGLVLLALTGFAIILSGFLWFGTRFAKALLELPQILAVAVGSGMFALGRRRPHRWQRGRSERTVSE